MPLSLLMANDGYLSFVIVQSSCLVSRVKAIFPTICDNCQGIKQSYHFIKQHLKQVFQSVYRHELETRLSHKPWKQEIAKTPDWPRRKAVAEFRLCVGHDCLGTHLHRTAIRPDPYRMICSLREPVDRNHPGQCTALLNRTECERYWEARIKMTEN